MRPRSRETGRRQVRGLALVVLWVVHTIGCAARSEPSPTGPGGSAGSGGAARGTGSGGNADAPGSGGVSIPDAAVDMGGGAGTSGSAGGGGSAGAAADGADWTLVWSDEFQGPDGSAVDASKWNYDVGGGDHGGGNN